MSRKNHIFIVFILTYLTGNRFMRFNIIVTLWLSFRQNSLYPEYVANYNITGPTCRAYA
jgi:hypothetical protein